jgi:hypothetical protein
MAPRSPARVVGAIAVLLLLGGLGVAFWQWRASVTPRPTPGAPAAGEPGGEHAVDQALALAEDSSAIKSRWIEDVSGIDLTGLPEPKRGIFLRFANAERCTCGCGYTLAGCRASDMECDVSGGRLAALLDSVRDGRITSAAGVRERPANAR